MYMCLDYRNIFLKFEIPKNLKLFVMKTKAVLILTLFTLAISGIACKGQVSPEEMNITGVWRLVRNNPARDSAMKEFPAEFTEIKQITDGHFSWMLMSDAEGTVFNGAGGTYRLDGDTYTETIDYGLPGMVRFIGKQAVYQIGVERDTMRISGVLDDQIEVREVWVRVRK